jgi:hypothetical protein
MRPLLCFWLLSCAARADTAVPAYRAGPDVAKQWLVALINGRSEDLWRVSAPSVSVIECDPSREQSFTPADDALRRLRASVYAELAGLPALRKLVAREHFGRVAGRESHLGDWSFGDEILERCHPGIARVLHVRLRVVNGNDESDYGNDVYLGFVVERNRVAAVVVRGSE